MADNERTYGTLVTDAGVALITTAAMEGKKINITQLAVGDGGGAYYQPITSMTELKNEKWRGVINSVSINEQSPNMIDVVAVIPSGVGGWTIREMSIFTDTGVMIAICNTPDTEKVSITSGASGEIELNMHIEISNTGVISFVIDPTVITATKKDIETHNTSAKAHEAQFQQKADANDLNNHVNNTDVHVTRAMMENYDTAIAGLIDHTEDTDSHVTAGEKAEWSNGAQAAAQAAVDAAQALNLIAGLEGRVARVEDGLFNNITGNPYLVSFDSLEGITLVKGIWNAMLNRIEC